MPPGTVTSPTRVRRLWPGVKVHSKIMISFSPYTYVSGVDPELWAEFSDLNGNDNICMQGGRYASDMAGGHPGR